MQYLYDLRSELIFNYALHLLSEYLGALKTNSYLFSIIYFEVQVC